MKKRPENRAAILAAYAALWLLGMLLALGAAASLLGADDDLLVIAGYIIMTAVVITSILLIARFVRSVIRLVTKGR